MLKQLTDTFYRLSTETEALLQHAIDELHSEHAPSAEDTLKISNALAGLQTAYSKVRDYAAQKLSAEEMPDERAPVSAYTAIIDSKRMITEGILREFLRAYTTSNHYEEILKDAQQKAQHILQIFQEDASSEPDVSPYKAFVDGVKMGADLVSDEGDRLLDIIETLDRKLARGLAGGHFSIREEAVCAVEELTPAVTEVPEAVPVEATPLQTSEETSPAAAEETVPASTLEEPGENAPESPACEPEVSYVYARNYKAASSLPSTQKLLKAWGDFTGSVFLYNMGSVHLFSQEVAEAIFPANDVIGTISAGLDLLESRGYLVSYEVDGAVYYCASQLLANCLKSSERAKILRRIYAASNESQTIFKKRKMSDPMLVGTEKIERDALLEHIAWSKFYAQLFRMSMPLEFWWDFDERHYYASGADNAKDTLFTNVACVLRDQYAASIAKETGAVFTYGDALPDAEEMHAAAAEHCFFYADAMYRWNGSEWTLFWGEDSGNDPEGSAPPTDSDAADTPAANDDAPAEPVEEAAESTEEPEADLLPGDADACDDSDLLSDDEPAEPETDVNPPDDEPDVSAPAPEPNDIPEEETVAKEDSTAVVTEQTPPSQTVIRAGWHSPSAIRAGGTSSLRDHYLKLAHQAYAECRKGIGSAMLRALTQMHPDVYREWLKWACASGDCAYNDGRHATKLQEIYPEMNSSSLADSALAVSAYIRMYFSNDAAKEYWVRSADTMSSSQLLRQMGHLRELMQRLQDYVNKNQHGINQAAIVSSHKESGIHDQFDQLQTAAGELVAAKLADTKISNPRVKDVLKSLFGNDSLMMAALQSICDDDRSMAKPISEKLEAIDPGLLTNSHTAIERWIESLWDNSEKKMKGKNANDPIKSSGRNIAVNRTKNALSVINQWVELCIHNDALPQNARIAAAAEVKQLAKLIPEAIKEVSAAKAALCDDVTGYGAFEVLEDTLRYFLALINGEGTVEDGAISNAEIAASEAMAVEENGAVYIIPAEDMAVPYEQCAILEGLLQTPKIDTADAAWEFVKSSMTEVNPNGGNFSNGRFLLKCSAKMYDIPLFNTYTDGDYAGRIRDAKVIAADADRKFHARMEMAQGYGWFSSYDEQERIEHAVAAQCEMYRSIDNFSACVDCMERTYSWCRETARIINHDSLMTDLNRIIQSFGVDENNAAISRIRKLIEQDCYTAATAEIRKIYSDGRVEDQVMAAAENKFEFFIQNFQTYYAAVQNVNTPLEEIFNIRNRHNHKNGGEMLKMWPQSPEAITPYRMRSILIRLCPEIDSVDSIGKSTDGHVAVTFKPRTSMDFAHPIADFGTNMIDGGLDVFYLGGNRSADQYFDMIRSQIGKSTQHAVIFFANSAMSLSTRRQLASKIWHELRFAKPLIILDRVLALFVAEHDKIDRWKVLLQCALPFTMVKPYTEKSNAQQPPEMFVGRVQELRKLMSFDQDGANLVYGGRQLGKSAILYRVEQELHNEAASTYAVLCAIKDMDAAAAVRHILLAMRRKNVPNAQSIPMDASWADMCFSINLILTDHPEMKLMLLIDEADVLLGKDKATGYSALSEIKRVQDAFGHRFKFVFAGLHNVMRLHNEALDNNSDLPKLGHVNIKPLDYADAETLLKKPLSFMGFMFNESEEQQALISMILSTTNYYPGLIHYYCASLLNTFSDGHTEPAPTKPPYNLDNKLILNLLQKEAFVEQTRQKFMMTLGIDKDEHQYYSILAHLMAYCYDENESRVDGVSVEDICEAAASLEIAPITNLEEKQVETLLDELCELNILYCAHGSDPKHYVFSRPAFKDMLGTEDNVLNELIKCAEVKEVSQ